MFTNHTKQVNSKLDFVIGEFDKIKQDMTVTKRQIVGLEQSVTFTSDKVLFMEKKELPKLHELILKEKEDLEEKLTLLEIYNRKQNLLVYGVQQPSSGKEDILTVTRDILQHFLHIGKKEAEAVPIINAHRLPRNKERATGPDPSLYDSAQ